ncbi:hypothetical protein [Methylobacter svalbardensis]|uniref:hypothetical protein n=1 Tax=Methylobacter svalbardensis TaxID=3080016 RepID=UPI0030ED6738
MLSPYHPLQLALGLAVWIVWFTLMYGALAVACELAPPPPEHGPYTWINVALLSSTLAITGLLLYWANACWRAAREGIGPVSESHLFIARLGAGINLTGAIATFCLGLMALLFPPCL